MRKMRYGVIVLWMLLASATAASAQLSIGIGFPNVQIGINIPLFPSLVPVPGYPVYYAPGVGTNYFFYDGLYWVYMGDAWYASYWYNGPWWIVEPDAVPVYILRVPVRYYRYPPPYFRGWRPDAPPRWGHHWGRGWEERHRGWDRWKRSSAPPRAPLPVYQRQYTGDRYPRQVERQQELRREHYRYQPRDKGVRQHFQPQGEQRGPAPGQRGRQEEQRPRGQRPQEMQRPAPHEQVVPRSQPQAAPQQRGPAYREQRQEPRGTPREYQAPRPQGQEQRFQERGQERGQEQGRGQGQGPRRDEERGR